MLVGMAMLLYRRGVFLETYPKSLITSTVFLALHLFFLIFATISYRLSSLHPLYKYPGPMLAKCTSLYLTYTVWIGKRHLIFHELHKRHGPFVRIGNIFSSAVPLVPWLMCLIITGPNTISINLHEAILPVYGTASAWNKTDAYHLGGLAGAGLFFIQDRDEHNARRKYWAPAFTNEAWVIALCDYNSYLSALIGLHYMNLQLKDVQTILSWPCRTAVKSEMELLTYHWLSSIGHTISLYVYLFMFCFPARVTRTTLG